MVAFVNPHFEDPLYSMILHFAIPILGFFGPSILEFPQSPFTRISLVLQICPQVEIVLLSPGPNLSTGLQLIPSQCWLKMHGDRKRRGPMACNAIGLFVDDVPGPNSTLHRGCCPIHPDNGRTVIRCLALTVQL